MSICREILSHIDRIYKNYQDEEWTALFDVDDIVVLFWFDC